MRRVALLIFLVPALASAAGEGPPRGKRAPRPKATHLVVAPTVLDAGGGVKMNLASGVPVAAGTVPAKGKVKVTVVGQVVVQGTVDAAALGKRVLVESELKTPAGARLGTARVGASVRVLAKKAPPGAVVVEGVGPVVFEALLPAEAIGPEPRDLVLKEDWTVKTAKPADLFPTAEVKGTPLARLEKDARLIKLEQKGEVLKVRTFGAFSIEGYTLLANLDDRSASDEEKPEPRIKPTHEVFVDAPLYGADTGKKLVGTVRGGALVQAEKRLVGDPAGRVKVKVLGGARAEGWIKLTDLRKLEDSVWSEETR